MHEVGRSWGAGVRFATDPSLPLTVYVGLFFHDPRSCDFFITTRPLTWPDQEPRDPRIVEGNQRDCSAGEGSQPFPGVLRCLRGVWGNIVIDSRGREAMRISLARSVSNRLGGFDGT